VLVGTACGGDEDDGDTARIDSGQPGAGAEVGDSVTTDDPDDDTDDNDGSDTTEADDGGAGSGSGSSSDEMPEDQALDIVQRHPTGVTLSVTRVGSEGQDLVVDAEVVNSSRQEITFHQGNYSSGRVKLVDDAGEEYNLIELEEDTPIALAPGDTVDASFAFRGPLLGEPERIYFTVNTYTEDVPDFDPEGETDSMIYPRFVVPIDLVWG
jgi:hypothetical protein